MWNVKNRWKREIFQNVVILDILREIFLVLMYVLVINNLENAKNRKK